MLPKPLISLYLRICVIFLTAFSLGYDWSSLNGLQSLTYWQEHFNHPTGSALGLLGSIQSVGNVVGLLVASYPADYLGRKWGIFIGNCFLVLGSVLQATSVNIGMYIAGRLFVGVGLAISTCSCPSLVVELAHPKHRSVLASTYFACFLIGGTAAAWITVGTFGIESDWSWRLPTILQIVTPIIQSALLLIVPESPRMAVSNGNLDYAYRFFEKYHSCEKDSAITTETQMAEIQAEIENSLSAKQTSWLTMVNTPGNRKRTMLCVLIPMFSQFSGNAVISYYLALLLGGAGITKPYTQTLINGGLQTWQMIIALIGSIYVVGRFGRKPLLLATALGCLLSFAAFTASVAVFNTKGSSGSSKASIAMVFIFEGFYQWAYNLIHVVYASEIYPSNLRVRGLAFITIMHDIFIFVNQYAAPVGLANIGWKFYLVSVAVDLVALPVFWKYFVEVKGRTLEQVAIAFDGDAAAVTHARDIPSARNGESPELPNEKSSDLDVPSVNVLSVKP